jgi:hypothetical protein
MRWLLILALSGCHPAGTSRASATGSTAASSVPSTVPEAALTDRPPAPDISCNQALAATVDYVGPASIKGKQSAGEIMLAHCIADSWTADVRRCFTQQPAATPQPCIDMLNNYQRQQMGEDLAAQLPK